MTQEEKVLQIRKVVRKMDDLFFRERDKLREEGTCTHEDTSDHPWEFDNGYGKQRKNIGKFCNACHKVDKYNIGSWSL